MVHCNTAIQGKLLASDIFKFDLNFRHTQYVQHLPPPILVCLCAHLNLASLQILP
jgi:hypothetical protein